MDGKSPKIPLTFRIFKGEELVRTETLTQSPIKIGKLSSSHLRLEDDESVSRMHAVIEVTSAADITIIDLGSTKGTVVNGKKINKATLQDGDIIMLGDTKIVLSVGDVEAMDEEPTAVAPAPPAISTAPTQAAPMSSRPVAPLPPTPPRAPASAPPAPPVGYQTGPNQSMPAAAARPMMPEAPPTFGMDASADLHGKRSIEVAAMLSDSVVAVRHISNPKSGKMSVLTYALIAIGVVGILSAAGSFINGVSVAKQNKELLRVWTEEEKKDAIDFRPIRMSPAMDFMAIIGFLGGIACIAWARTRSIGELASPYFRIGSGKEVEFPLDSLPGHMASFPLVEPAPGGNDFVFSWTDGMKGEMTIDGKVTPLEQLPRSGPIPHKARIRVETGQNTFFVSSVPAPRAPTSGFHLEAAVVAFFGVSAGLHLLMVILMYLIAPEGSGYSNDDLDNDLRGTRVQIKAQEDPKQPEKMENNKDDGKQSGGTGQKMADAEGKMGKKDSDRKSGQYAIEKVANVDPQLAKQQLLEKSRTAGILGVLNAQHGGTFASLTATGDFSAGLDERDIQGGLIGNEPGEMAGGWGYGVSGTGAGGGGTGMGTIGRGNYGTIGHGAGTGTGYGIGNGTGGLKNRVPKGPMVSIGSATATGDLDKNTIRRYVRQHIQQIEYCYQKELTIKPNLSGTVNTAFTIDGNGRVIAASAGGFDDAEVSSCVKGIIEGIQFPRPTGGGTVNVTSYPFTFRPTGA